MSNPVERIQSDVKAALKAGEKERLSTLRMLLAELKNERIRAGSDLDQDAFYAVVKRLIKQRREASTQYREGNRPELADKEEREIGYLEGYLPAQLSEAEMRRAVEELVEAEGLSGPKALGRVMGTLMQRFAGRIDGAALQRIAREVLGAG